MAEDISMFLFTDSIEEASKYIERNAIDTFHLRKKNSINPIRIFGETKI